MFLDLINFRYDTMGVCCVHTLYVACVAYVAQK